MIVVTGASGHLGNCLIRELLNQGYEDILAVIHPKDDLISLMGLPIKIVKCDVRDKEGINSIIKSADIVFHLAGMVYIGSKKIDVLYDVNVNGTKNIINACLNSNVKKLIYVSSVHAFPETENNDTIVETKNFDPNKVVGDYAKSKAIATIEVLKAFNEGLDGVIVHPSGIIGPYQFKLTHTGQMLLNFVKSNICFYIDGAYDFVDVRDVAKGIILALKFGRRGENYILSGERITIEEIINTIEEIKSKKMKIRIPTEIAKAAVPFVELYYHFTNKTPTLTKYSLYTLNSNSNISCEKAKKELSYSPMPIRESIKDTIIWIEKERDKRIY